MGQRTTDVELEKYRAGAAEIRWMEPYRHLDPRLDALSDDARLWEPCAPVIGSRAVRSVEATMR